MIKNLEKHFPCKESIDLVGREILKSSVQLISHVQLIATPCTAVHQASLSIINCQSSLKLTSIDSVMPSLLLSPSPPAFNLSQLPGLFKWVSSSHQVAKILVSASASVLPMNIQDKFPLGWTAWISLLFRGL